MTTHLFDSLSAPRRPLQMLHRDIGLAKTRVHECCGESRHTFAVWLAGRMEGTVMWISPAWQKEKLNPDGMWPFVDPGRFIFVDPRRAEDLLWCIEEALRSGVVPLVVADLPAPPNLTAVRRMHLAAEQGAERTGNPRLGLLVTPGNGGAPGVETRWAMSAAYLGKIPRWHLERRRARTEPVKSWTAIMRAPRTEMEVTPGAPVLTYTPPDVPLKYI